MSTSLQTICYETYLQGSYRNDTNIRADSDVDVVAELGVFMSNRSDLAADELLLYDKTFETSSYTLQDFRNDVFKALVNYYGGGSASIGNKSFRVEAKSGRLGADLVVCQEYRKYESFGGKETPFTKGIAIWDASDRRWVINYPKLHYDNGVTKNSQTHDWYKPTVRMFKNARGYLVDNRTIAETLAPSYFLECMLYNVPSSNFGVSFQDTYCAVVNWLTKSDLSKLICQNQQVPLFGNTPEQWALSSAKTLLDNLVRLWTHWRE